MSRMHALGLRGGLRPGNAGAPCPIADRAGLDALAIARPSRRDR